MKLVYHSSVLNDLRDSKQGLRWREVLSSVRAVNKSWKSRFLFRLV